MNTEAGYDADDLTSAIVTFADGAVFSLGVSYILPTDWPAMGQSDRVELLGMGFEWPNAGMVHGFDHTLGYNPLRLADFTRAVGAGCGRRQAPRLSKRPTIIPRGGAGGAVSRTTLSAGGRRGRRGGTRPRVRRWS